MAFYKRQLEASADFMCRFHKVNAINLVLKKNQWGVTSKIRDLSFVPSSAICKIALFLKHAWKRPWLFCSSMFLLTVKCAGCFKVTIS